ncbi:MAG: sulfatase-like hydrolase/transferase [Limisphaerales bacterium]
MKHYRSLILVCLTLQLALAGQAESLSSIFTNVASAPAVLPRRPNIILITTHGLGYGDLSSYGQVKFQTPNLDNLAAGGIRFTNYSVGGVASSPVRAALLTGINPQALKQREDVDVTLAPDEITVAQILKKSGYHTALIGEWDLGGDGTSGAPWNKGFDEFGGYFDPADAENYYADYIFRYTPNQSYDKATGKWIEWSPAQGPPTAGREMLYANIDGKRGQYIPDLYTKAAMNFIANSAPDQFNHYRPFFLLLDYAMPRVNVAETIRTGNGMQVPTDAPYSSEPWPQAEKNRAAMIARLDGDIGKLVQQLQKLRQESNTVVFFTSVGLPKKTGGVDPQFFRSVLSTNDLRAPMIVNWPGKIPAGQVSGLKWSPRDFLPTAAEIGMVQVSTNLPGASILPVLLGRPSTNSSAMN